MSTCKDCGFPVALFGTKERPLCGGCQTVHNQRTNLAALIQEHAATPEVIRWPKR